MQNARTGLVGLVSLLVTSASGDAAASECLTASGKTACGFHCEASDGEVRCAQTAAGVCSITSGVVACWDPPPILRRLFGERVPQPSCVTTYGQTACGYSCETNSDRALCAQTPFGECRASDGKIACWDPPAAVVAAKRDKTPHAACISSLGKIACGYHCQNYDGVLRCSETPEGTCSVEQGHLVCWDPPLDTYQLAFEPSAELACIDGADGRSCGYRCIATSRHSACGSSRGNSCWAEPDRLVCKNPD
jgi:hypothetical protein